MSSMLLEFFCECGDEMFGWSRGFGVFIRSWSGSQVLSEVADMMVGYWSIAYKAVGLGTKGSPCAIFVETVWVSPRLFRRLLWRTRWWSPWTWSGTSP